MKKSDLITALSEKENLSDKMTAEIINLIFRGFSEAFKKNKRIEIRRFGTFSVRKYKSYTGRNPKTGAKTKVKPKRLPFFKVSKGLKRVVDGA